MAWDSCLGHPDHDACGTGFVVQLGQAASHQVVQRALLALQRLSHRGGTDADGASGDGAGLLTQIPEIFVRNEAHRINIDLPEVFGLGMVFLPPDEQPGARKMVEETAREMGFLCPGWREVPTDLSVLGRKALTSRPAIWQCFLTPNLQFSDLEQRLFLLRKRIEAQSQQRLYFCSLSSRTVVYKGLLAPWQLPLFYPDLASPDFASKFAVFHQRYSTNTQPSWSLAQPFRYMAHNGEINTIVGNRRWMKARTRDFHTHFETDECFHPLENKVSDSANLDNAIELLVQQGFGIGTAMLTLVPPAFDSSPDLPVETREFFRAAGLEYEPWDGPAALIFSDGRRVGAKLDRNGLRPLRYTLTSDGLLIAGSEVGLADFSDHEVIERGRLGPGEILLADIGSGTVLRNRELLATISQSQNQIQRCTSSMVEKGASFVTERVQEPKRLAAALGWTDDQLKLLFQPLSEGKEPIWSMGDDTPPAFLSQMRRTLWDYCKQRFAQVTNPPIDPLRETHVMSLQSSVGSQWILQSPILDQGQLSFLKSKFADTQVIDVTFDVAGGPAAGVAALERICEELRTGDRSDSRLVVVSDRAISRERAALPVLLVVAAVWEAMQRQGRFRDPLLVETGQVIDTHHLALLITAGATAVCPFLAIQLAEESAADGPAGYVKAVQAALYKVLSRMGISTLASYRNGCVFELVGLDEELCNRFFPDTACSAGAKSLEQLLQDYLDNHTIAFLEEQHKMRDAGLYRYRKDAEHHGSSPELMRKLHAHVKNSQPSPFEHVEQIGQERVPIAIRDLLDFVADNPVDLDEVELETSIFPRFSTQAMSLGAISVEAHRTLAIAMNRLGGRSNTGEGGEDPLLPDLEPEAVNRIKQIASGRFGVTTRYLVHADEIEIKMAQGAKPGEGGQLPANKVSPYIATLRHAVPGMALISPPPHHDIYSIEDLAQLIYDLREVNPYARIGVKLVASAGVGVIATGVAKAGADVITIAGHDGGTGAAPLSSIKNTGLPWEFGLRDAHRALVQTGFRDGVRLRVDGGLKFGRDVVIAALLGADEFGFGTAALLAMGCVMARQCHLNTCPVGIATQDELLRTRFTGKPEMVIAYFQGIAGEIRKLLGMVGAHTLGEIVGDTKRLKARCNENSSWIDALFEPPQPGCTERNFSLPSSSSLSGLLLQEGASGSPFKITTADRSVGARLSGDRVRRAETVASEAPVQEFEFTGIAGQSFGAFLIDGVHFQLSGEANDYVGKGLSGGTIAISAGNEASLRGDVVAGNTILYGATSGELYVAGRAGERFAVRNSGAAAVVEGVGDHGCEYMTGGVVVILGPTGINLGSGMTGGLTYVLQEHLKDTSLNPGFVRVEQCSEYEQRGVRRLLLKHHRLTGSPVASALLEVSSLPIVRVAPLKLPCTVEEIWAPVVNRLKVFHEAQGCMPVADLGPEMMTSA
ncbi:MAG TPA: glutamate synthase large subunit [Terriglobales bacterium]